MSSPVSIIIPTYNSANDLPATLASLLEGINNGLVCELIVSDYQSKDATKSIALTAGARFIIGAKGRGAQLNAGARVAKGMWLFFLHADTTLSPGWWYFVQSHIQTSTHAGYAQLVFKAEGIAPRLVAAWANLRARLFGLPYGDQGLLISRRLFKDINGYADYPLMEDVNIAAKLRWRKRPLQIQAITKADRYIAHGWFRQGSKNLMTLGLYYLGCDPEKLAQRYRR